MDIEHFYIEEGKGFPLILLHGNGENAAYFENQISELKKHFRVIALDTRGHGKTPRGDAPFTIRQFARDLAAFMDRLSIEKAHILGFSDGANIAMCFALSFPERVEKLILDGGNLDPSGVKRTVQIPIEIGYKIAKRFREKSYNARLHAEMLGLMVNDPNIPPEELSRISSETLVIAGTRDIIKKSHTEKIASSIPNAKAVFLDGDHFIAAKNPKDFNRAVLGFLL